MTDLHTHILPGIDDGARDTKVSLAMLRQQREQGVDRVVLTPHFYRDRERPAWFLDRRKKAMEELELAIQNLPDEKQRELPDLVLGAEVAWAPNLSDWDELPQMCIGNTRNMLLELPFTPWNGHMIDQLYDIPGRTGLSPVIAHLERYMNCQRPEYIREILALGFPVQVSAQPLLHPLSRGKVLKMLQRGQAHLIASDCHNLTERLPNLGTAMAVVERKAGTELTLELRRMAWQLTQPEK